ncbi:MAG: hypothetical protein AAF911_10335 [Planctomycetota bacterium]
MTHASDKKHRRQKRKRWQQRGGGGMKRVGRGSGGGPRMRTGAIGKASPFWQAVIGIATIAVIVGAVALILIGIFAA